MEVSPARPRLIAVPARPTLDETNRRRRFAQRRGVDDWPRDDVGSRIGHRPPSDGCIMGPGNRTIRAEQRRRSIIIIVQWCSRRRERTRARDRWSWEMSRTKHGQRGAAVRGLVDVV